MSKKANNWFSENWFYLAIALIGLVFIGVYYINTLESFKWGKFWPLMFKEAGIAILIAIILIFTVEKISRKRHELAADNLLDSINKNLFKAVYKRYIPEVVFREVERCLLNNVTLRKGYRIDIRLDSLDETQGIENYEDYFICSAYSAYELVNLTDTEVEETIGFSLDVPNESDLTQLTRIVSFIVEGLEHIENHIPANDEGLCEFYTNIKIPANSSIKVSMQGTTAKRKIDSEIWSSKLPSDGITISLTTPNNTKVSCKSNHSRGVLCTKEHDGQSIWELDYGIFPHQSFVVWWNGKL